MSDYAKMVAMDEASKMAPVAQSAGETLIVLAVMVCAALAMWAIGKLLDG